MLDVREHRQVLSALRETRGRALGDHRREIDEQRRNWRRARGARPAVHRVVLERERQEMQELRRQHRRSLAQNRWLVALADRLQERLRSAR
ncbi:MAG: hypothetical protein QN141_03600 [Armatimonadota bacterium]|nr:hypothetical protein [Armatimonadota bacterium]MDR7451429.1 hypothetical protein [Armatimonadota bacterium]MDR7466421.1 hypothetical protein [Armatimonadota bacterium]MDR7493143.1 hypothetical protein [Armatimonadota bacterium]MDR7500332.1 hypothetical protein [Armatimonadota bacterium]